LFTREAFVSHRVKNVVEFVRTFIWPGASFPPTAMTFFTKTSERIRAASKGFDRMMISIAMIDLPRIGATTSLAAASLLPCLLAIPHATDRRSDQSPFVEIPFHRSQERQRLSESEVPNSLRT
jgi:hypothetical protein